MKTLTKQSACFISSLESCHNPPGRSFELPAGRAEPTFKQIQGCNLDKKIFVMDIMKIMNFSKIDALHAYKKYYSDRDYERVDLFRKLKTSFDISKVVYPGCYIHVSPSFIFPNVVYIDSDKKAINYFRHNQLIELVSERKEYPEDPIITFHGIDYRELIQEYRLNFDLLISQYAGFISDTCKPYLKIGGYLLVNNSHADAGLASIDEDYKLISTVHRSKGKHRLSNTHLGEYFIPKKDITVKKELLKERMRGIGYTKTAALYIFQRTS